MRTLPVAWWLQVDVRMSPVRVIIRDDCIGRDSPINKPQRRTDSVSTKSLTNSLGENLPVGPDLIENVLSHNATLYTVYVRTMVGII